MNALTWGRDDRTRRSTRDFPQAVLELVTERQGGKFCAACRAAGRVVPDHVPLQIDHMQPLSKGGTNHWSNLRWLCESCNTGRGNRRDAPSVPKWARGSA